MNNRTAGSTIVEGFFNDIHQAMNSDFVGRNATGVPTSGQNLGTVSVPWGTVRANSLVLNGNPVDVSAITSPPNRIISGRKRSSSNQPQYLDPDGAALSVTVQGGTTDLIYDVNGTEVTFGSDVVKSSLTPAPSSNNTALVDDTDAADQADTRTWGEPESQKAITIDTVGSEISSLVGKFASFKIDNGSSVEYFLAFVKSSTKLTHCRRGFYYDASGNPINRIVFSNNDTITLMKTGWLFAENDGTTVDVTYNNPTWSAESPAGPATGDYWYDMANEVWKRYDGAAFQIINRTFIGIVIMNTTAAVAARSVDFYAAYSDQIQLPIEKATTEIARAMKIGGYVNVAGNMISYAHSLPTWNITTDLATSVDMYDATEQASRAYYLYVKDTGETIMSDIEPYFRDDLQGRYHPHNPWRCVGAAYNDSGSDIANAGGFLEEPIVMALSVDQTINNSTDTKVALDTLLRGSESKWDTTNYKWTSVSRGVLRLTASMNYGGTTGAFITQIVVYKNGSPYNASPISHAANASAYAPGNAMAIDLAVDPGDYIEFYVKQTSGGSATLQSTNTIASLQMIDKPLK